MFDKIKKSVKKAMAPKPSRAEKAYNAMVRENGREAEQVMRSFQNRLNCLGYDIVPHCKPIAENVVVAEIVLKSISYQDFVKMSQKKTDEQAAEGNQPVPTDASPDAPEGTQNGSEATPATLTTAEEPEKQPEASEDGKAQAED